MGLSTIGQVAQRLIATTLRTPTGDGTNYTYDLSREGAVQFGPSAMPWTGGPASVWLMPPRAAVEHGVTLGAYTPRWTFALLGFVQAETGTSLARWLAALELARDLQKAIEADRGMGGLVDDSIVQSVDAEDGQFVDVPGWGVCSLEVGLYYSTTAGF